MSDVEEWCNIEGFTDYAVSSHGRVKNLKYGRLLKPYTNTYSQSLVRLYRDGRGYTKLVHRLVAETFYDLEFPNKPIKHIDGDKSNCREDNLIYVNNSRLGRRIVGFSTRKPTRILEVVEAQQRFNTVQEAAKRLYIYPSGIYRVLSGHSKSYNGLTFRWLKL